MTTALAADRVWFNSAFHRDSFLEAMHKALRKMPDYRLPDVVQRIREKSAVEPLGIRDITPRERRPPGPLRLLWAARWEYDKDPETFFAALRELKQRGAAFRLSAIGERYAESPEVFDQARLWFADEIDRWGFQPSRAEYEQALREADVVVSTAQHEFFGVSIIEAIAAGAFPALPRRLAYPEILNQAAAADLETFFYDGDVESLTHRLSELIDAQNAGDLWHSDPGRAHRAVQRYLWPRRAPDLDAALERIE